MNDALIEAEVKKRVQFKMNEFWTSFENHMKRNEHYKWASMNKDSIMRATHYIDAYEEIRGILRKEIDLPTALDGEMAKRNWENKEELVSKISVLTRSFLKNHIKPNWMKRVTCIFKKATGGMILFGVLLSKLV